MEQKYSNVQERIDILNNNAQVKSVLDSIDRPIRPLVVELNRIGLQTIFSCCGYTYEDQEEPKTHGDCPYILFEVSQDDVYSVKNFFKLSSVVVNLAWLLNIAANGREWCLHSPYNEKWKNQDNLPESIHDYELKLIHITKLTKVLRTFPSCLNKIVINDGNAQRRSLYGDEWMVAPKKATVIEVDKIYTLNEVKIEN